MPKTLEVESQCEKFANVSVQTEYLPGFIQRCHVAPKCYLIQGSLRLQLDGLSAGSGFTLMHR